MRQQEGKERPQSKDGNGNGRRRGTPVADDIAARVRERALGALSPSRRATSDLYLDPVILERGTALGPSFEHYVVDRASVLCFADHEPRANFAHSCSYLLYDAATGNPLHRIAARFPPYPVMGLQVMQRFHQPGKPAAFLQQRTPAPVRERRMLSAPTGRRHAILFAGTADPHHLNDLELCLRTLTDTFGFARADIFVLFHNGTTGGSAFLDFEGNPRTWPGSQTDSSFRLVPDGKGSRAAFRAVLGRLNPGADDMLFIHTEGHGAVDFSADGGGQYLCAFPDDPADSDRYFDFQMQADLRELAGYRSLLVLMNQCFAGGFGDAVIAGSTANRTFVACACGEDAVSYASDDLNWNEFSRNWIEAEMQRHVDPTQYMPVTDVDLDGNVEASEAYHYCVDVNRLIKGGDTPFCARMPPPDPQDRSPADEISLM